ncbi:MAG: 2-oxoglutarate dehydrogenase E1 component, partial [Bacteroidota bacterium]
GLDLERFGLSESNLDEQFNAGTALGLGETSLRNIIDFLERTYCGTVGVEYMYARIPGIIEWVQENFEQQYTKQELSVERKKAIAEKLHAATSFEQFIHRKFPGQKRFSLEGGESMIPALDGLILHGSNLGVEEFVIGMAHRGRLNVLTSILRKEPDSVFGEFKDKGVANKTFDGDVKYHLAHSSDPMLENGKTVHLSLLPNPSHLEAIDPIVGGTVRAKMENAYDGDSSKICPILIHGDAAVAGQGVVYEVIQMSRLRGYGVGGTVHYVINNQLGFTTEPEDCRTSTYCTAIAMVTLSPVFHVNGDDPEGLYYVSKLAMEFRQRFKRDVFIDLMCFRKYGHNEGDEPRFTQPVMYAAIDKHKSVSDVYLNQLLEENTIQKSFVESLKKKRKEYLDKELDQAVERDYKDVLEKAPTRFWEGLKFYDIYTVEQNPTTGWELDKLKEISKKLTQLPEGFEPHRNIERLMKMRYDMVFEDNALDWGMGEHLAYATLLIEGYPVRLSGQDVERGTFSHRHSVLHNQKNNDLYVPLNELDDKQAKYAAYNSLLSEYAVLGFEVGYSWATPKALTIWEAQFGGFINGAQIVVDHFITSGHTKWQRMLGLVLLLPHGYEGQGPEHSSARPERFLNLAARNNMFVTNITTPANFFHALRRQLHVDTRRPLIVFTPKSLLRSPEALSPLEDFGPDTHFQEILDDANADPKNIKRIVLCTGKVAYDLLRNRDAHKKSDTAIIRVEQLYPSPAGKILELVKKKYKKAETFVWAQEEPENMGYWYFVNATYDGIEFSECVSRKPTGSPATGSPSQHKTQQAYIVRKALDLSPEAEVKV